MNSFFDKLKEVSDNAGVPTPSLTPPPMKAPPKPTATAVAPPAPEMDPEVTTEATSDQGLEDAADSDCVTPDDWEAPEVFDDLYDEEDD